MTQQEARERVQRGAALLDQKKPGWADLIEQDKLCMTYCCILDFVYGRWETGIQKLFQTMPMEPLANSVVYGFTPGQGEGTVLRDAWLEAIADRVSEIPTVVWEMRDKVEA